jgi:hypothetical protein
MITYDCSVSFTANIAFRFNVTRDVLLSDECNLIPLIFDEITSGTWRPKKSPKGLYVYVEKWVFDKVKKNLKLTQDNILVFIGVEMGAILDVKGYSLDDCNEKKYNEFNKKINKVSALNNIDNVEFSECD